MISGGSAWIKEYRDRPYLKHASLEELNQRYDDVAANIITIGRNGKIWIAPEDQATKRWLRLLMHVEGELRGRGQRPDRRLVTRSHLLRGTDSIAAAVVGVRSLPRSYLVKYSEERFIHQALKEGKIRLAPATRYGDPSLNPAIQDDELRLETFYPPEEVTVTIGGRPVDVTGNIKIQNNAQTNFLVHCFSESLEPGLFGQFESNACLLVRDCRAFLERLLRATIAALPGWGIDFRRVVYIDPFDAPKERPGLGFCKHFRYSYQKEARLRAVPPTNRWNLEDTFVSLGPLDDIAEMITLPPSWSPPADSTPS